MIVDPAEPAWVRSGDGSMRVDVHATLLADPGGRPARVRIRAAHHEHRERPSAMPSARASLERGVRGAIDGFLRLLGTFVLAAAPDCRALHCLES